eukprot:TRINITY_DN6137_c0_g2_i2.p1 TRINITY_DN6137_c0_g2~~TRINITY_DN6137_c0_g2_i2.p1  ORF type:complete len:593 (-),score=112.05 TRINITY_DN6137_c0_g2_i2:173-1951(-)
MELYERLRILGRGAYGLVHLVRPRRRDGSDQRSQRVLKEIDLSQLTEVSRREAHKEAEVLRSLSHVNIVRLVGTFLETDRLCIVMEYADGGDLADVVKQKRETGMLFEEAEVMATFAQCCLGLQHAHTKHILHRDIKCQNIFLMRSGLVKLGDFGIAKVLDTTTAKAKTCVGTPYYSSPEVVESQPYGLKADIWSLGVVLYELLALEPPFYARNLVQLVLKIIQSEPKALPEQFGEQVRQLILRLLSKDADGRPTCDELLATPYVAMAVGSLATQKPLRPAEHQEATATSIDSPQGQHGDASPAGFRLLNHTELPTLPGSEFAAQAQGILALEARDDLTPRSALDDAVVEGAQAPQADAADIVHELLGLLQSPRQPDRVDAAGQIAEFVRTGVCDHQDFQDLANFTFRPELTVQTEDERVRHLQDDALEEELARLQQRQAALEAGRVVPEALRRGEAKHGDGQMREPVGLATRRGLSLRPCGVTRFVGRGADQGLEALANCDEDKTTGPNTISLDALVKLVSADMMSPHERVRATPPRQVLHAAPDLSTTCLTLDTMVQLLSSETISPRKRSRFAAVSPCPEGSRRPSEREA